MPVQHGDWDLHPAPDAPDGVLPAIIFDGHPRILAALPPKLGAPPVAPAFAAAVPLIPESEWVDNLFGDAYNTPVLDQNGYSSCVGHSGAGAMMLGYAMQGGPRDVHLSAFFLYSYICGGRDAGANLGDAVASLQAHGICLESEVPSFVRTPNGLPTAAVQDASALKLVKAYSCSTWDEIGTALQLNWPVMFAMCVGNAYTSLDSEGVAGRARGYPNHSQFLHGAKFLKGHGQWAFRNRNSWGTRFGDNGNCYILREHLPSDGSIEAYAYQTMSPGSQTDPNLPPPVIP